MKSSKVLIALTAVVGAVGWNLPTARADNMVLRETGNPGSYCHLKYSAIEGDKLAAMTPSLSTAGDLIDFYGSCDHDPLGKDEVQAQRIESQHRFASDYED